LGKRLFFVALVALGIAALWIWKPWSAARRGEPVTIRTTIRVLEGSVHVYDLDDRGGRRYRGIVKEGEVLVVRTRKDASGAHVRRGAGAEALGLLKPVVPLAASFFHEEMERYAARMRQPQVTRFFTQEEFAEFIGERLGRETPFSDVRVDIRKDGWTGRARVRFLGVATNATGSGYVGVDRERFYRLYLKLDEVRIGFFRVPQFLLRELEQAFGEAAGAEDHAVEILEMNYEDGGIRITIRKI
jgi:hypothetical protein